MSKKKEAIVEEEQTATGEHLLIKLVLEGECFNSSETHGKRGEGETEAGKLFNEHLKYIFFPWKTKLDTVTNPLRYSNSEEGGRETPQWFRIQMSATKLITYTSDNVLSPKNKYVFRV